MGISLSVNDAFDLAKLLIAEHVEITIESSGTETAYLVLLSHGGAEYPVRHCSDDAIYFAVFFRLLYRLLGPEKICDLVKNNQTSSNVYLVQELLKYQRNK